VQHFLQGGTLDVPGPLIFKIHGSVSVLDEIVLTEADYRNLLYHEPGYRAILSAVFITKVVLMIGFSFADPELAVLTESIRESLKRRSAPDFLVLPKGEKGAIERRRLQNDFGIEVIEYEATEGHPELLQLIDHLAMCEQPPVSVKTSECSNLGVE
jgi:hypothetical protein